MVYTDFMKFIVLVLLFMLFISCASQESITIQDIVILWTDITHTANKENLIKDIDNFAETLRDFQNSPLYYAYSAIPYSPLIERSFRFYQSEHIPEFVLISDLVLMYRDSILTGDSESASAISAEISGILMALLIIDGEAQRFVSSSYLQLLITLIVFILLIVMLVRFLYLSLNRSLNREAQGTYFSHAYMLAQDEERGRISRELHDTVIQDMRYVLLETEKIGSTGDKNEREALSAKILPMVADLIRKTRDMCNNLIPPDFRFSELHNALKQLCLDFNVKTGIECRAEIDGNINLDSLSMEKRLQIFRIIQEALSNIEKHSGAKEAIVTMCLRQGNLVSIGISDDGIGFMSPLDSKGQIIGGMDKTHIGIISMKERAVILSGVLTINTAPGEGTLVCLEIPLNHEKTHKNKKKY